MSTSRKVATGLLASAVILAIAIPGLVQVSAILSAGEIFESATTAITIVDPPTIPIADNLPIVAQVLNIFTTDGDAPSSEVLVEVDAQVNVALGVGATIDSQSAEFTLDGTLTPGGLITPGTWTGTAPVVDGTLCTDCVVRGNAAAFFNMVVDVSDADAFNSSAFTNPVSTIVRAFAKVATSYSGYGTRTSSTGINAADAVQLVMNVLPNADGDENGVPDVTQLFSGNGQTEPETVDGNKVKTTWSSMGGLNAPPRGVIVTTVNLGDTLTVSGGTLFIDVTAGGLNALVNAITADAAFDPANRADILAAAGADTLEGVLILSRSNSSDSLTEGNNPISDFDLMTEDPSGTFMTVTILLSLDTPATDFRALDMLPAGYAPLLVLSGDAIAENIQDDRTDGLEVFAYRYPTDVTVVGEDLINTSPDPGMWNNVEDDGSLLFFTDLSRTVVPPAALADGLSIILTTGSGVIGTTVAPKVGGGGGGSSGICFIATAAYGTPMANEINVLRGLRDSYMLNNMVGTAFVDTYYRLSPPIADVVAHNAVAKALVRTLLVPVVMLSGFALAMPGATAMLLLVAFAFAGYRVRKGATRS